MEYDEAREIHKGDVIFCYNLILQHLNDNIGIYQREIDNINKEEKRKLAPFKKRLTETRRLLKKVIKNKGDSIKSI